MPRSLRPDLPGIPVHVVQRGVNRAPCFLLDADRERYLHWLKEASHLHGCEVHAYVLMDNHVHLLMTPTRPGGLSRCMHRLGSRFVPYFNTRHGRVGVLWERRFRGCLVDNAAYLVACHRYIELNPVRAGMVSDPADYRWSSYRHHALGLGDPLVLRHQVLDALGTDDRARRQAYRDLVGSANPGESWVALRREVDRNGAFGSDEFRARVGSAAARNLDRGRGQPPKK